MRTLVISDLHLGCGKGPGVFVGAAALVALLDRLGRPPLRVVLNGDTFDFPAQASGGGDALAILQALVDDPEVATVLARLGQVVRDGGSLRFHAGEHDLELREPALQAALITALGIAPTARGRVSFAGGEVSTVLEIGAARVVVTRRSRRRSRPGARGRLVRELLNPLRRHFGIGLAELLRPDYDAVALVALAVNPIAAGQLLRSLGPGASWIGEGAARGLGLDGHLRAAGLSAQERRVFARALETDMSLAPGDFPRLDRARLRVFRHGLGIRPAVDDDGLRRIEGDERAALAEAARRAGAAAVIVGDSHVPAWVDDGEVALVDPGAWTSSLAAVGRVEARARLAAWQRIHGLDARGRAAAAAVGLGARVHAALAEPLLGGGGRLALLECGDADPPVVLRARRLEASR